jgi:hypothetical protein
MEMQNPAPPPKNSQISKPAGVTPQQMEMMQSANPKTSTPEMKKAKNDLRRVIQQTGVDPQKIIQGGKYAAMAMKDPSMYQMALQMAVKDGILDPDQVPKTAGIDYGLIVKAISAGKLVEELIQEGGL